MNGPNLSGLDIGSPYSSIERSTLQSEIAPGFGLARYFALICSLVNQESLASLALFQSPPAPSSLIGSGIPFSRSSQSSRPACSSIWNMLPRYAELASGLHWSRALCVTW